MKNILTEFIEIYINQIIYQRALYPRQIFRKHKAYAIPVYCSIYPPLNDYLKGTLKAIEELVNKNELKSMELLIYNNENDYRESFVIDNIRDFSVSESDKYLMSIHDEFRKCLYELEIKSKSLRKFTRSAKFKINLHTKEKMYRRLCNESKHQVSIISCANITY